MSVKLFRKYLGVVIGIIFLFVLFFHGRLRDYDEGRYQDTPPQSIIDINKIKFEEVSKAYGLGDAWHSLYTPNIYPVLQKYLPFVTVRPYVSVVDINQDGFMDLFFLETLPEKPSRLFLNEEGKSFRDITDQLDVLKQKGQYGATISAWADFNNDGKQDFFTSKAPCFSLFLQTGDMQFTEVEERPDYCSVPAALNIFDFNRDGNLDVGVANYFTENITKDASEIFQQIIGLASKTSRDGGEPNVIFLGDGTGKFTVFQPESLKANKGRTTTFGVSYVDHDLWPDIFVANDYTFDEMYLNQNGTDLKNVTNQYIPRFYHGFSGMNSDFADFDLDGKLDLFVTNGWGPPSSREENLLWKKSADGSRFVEWGKESGVFKCGWAWGAKFADYDLDGDLDLFVTNGRSKGKKAKSFKESRSINYLRIEARSIPEFLRDRLMVKTSDKTINFADSDFQYYGFERNCVFSQHEGKFYDVAPFAGVHDLENGRSVVSFDIENDGKIDIAIGNTDGPLLLYRNVTENDGNWVGLNPENKFGLPYHGAIVITERSDKKPLRKELFIGNGGRGMSDPRIHFGLGEHTLSTDEAIVIWPDGKKELFKVKINKYNKLQYGTGVSL